LKVHKQSAVENESEDSTNSQEQKNKGYIVHLTI
jgi:hypothetical protein